MNETSYFQSIAIIGAGIAGLTLALALNKHNVSCTIYEYRDAKYLTTGAIMLAPNALRCLDALGVYKRIRPRGLDCDTLIFMDENYKIVDSMSFGDESQYGYRGLRIHRQAVLDELHSMVAEQHIPLHYGKKFTKILSETEREVSFEFSDGSIDKALLLIGADGIHSNVRRHISPAATGIYVGSLAIVSTVQTSDLHLPGFELNNNPILISGTRATCVLIPQGEGGREALVVCQRQYPDQGREGWQRLEADKVWLKQALLEDLVEWSAMLRDALENSDPARRFCWAYHMLPRQEKWVSPLKKIIIIGDAVHAIPPTAGQGACQAVEDSYTLAKLLVNATGGIPFPEALDAWQAIRQAKVDKVTKLTIQLNNSRLSKPEQEKLARGELWKSDEAQEGLDWLYQDEADRGLMHWLTKRKEHG